MITSLITQVFRLPILCATGIMIDSRFVITTLILVVILIEVQSIFLPRRADNMYIGREKVLADPKKRPFCNAFTGCGRKRSNLPPLSTPSNNDAVAPIKQHHAPPNFANDETIDSLLDLSAEPAVEDLSRQIMSEAKLWEAIQEANMELLRRKQESEEIGTGDLGLGGLGDMGMMASSSFDEDEATPARSATASCALPPCYI